MKRFFNIIKTQKSTHSKRAKNTTLYTSLFTLSEGPWPNLARKQLLHPCIHGTGRSNYRTPPHHIVRAHIHRELSSLYSKIVTSSLVSDYFRINSDVWVFWLYDKAKYDSSTSNPIGFYGTGANSLVGLKFSQLTSHTTHIRSTNLQDDQSQFSFSEEPTIFPRALFSSIKYFHELINKIDIYRAKFLFDLCFYRSKKSSCGNHGRLFRKRELWLVVLFQQQFLSAFLFLKVNFLDKVCRRFVFATHVPLDIEASKREVRCVRYALFQLKIERFYK